MVAAIKRPGWLRGVLGAVAAGAFGFGLVLALRAISDLPLYQTEQTGYPHVVVPLILAPLATELPEKANSFFWVREGKDALALGNITGAMVFQSTIPIFVGMVFIDWNLDRYAVVSMLLGLAGGAVAYWALRKRGEFGKLAIALWLLLYLSFLAMVLFG